MDEQARTPLLSKAKMGMIVAIVTIVGSILVGGANFGELKATVAQHEIRLKAIEGQLALITENTQKISEGTARMSTDLSWIKITMAEYIKRIQKDNLKEKENGKH
jgi:hypothetical protein